MPKSIFRKTEGGKNLNTSLTHILISSTLFSLTQDKNAKIILAENIPQ
ncbi:hypothetical protein [Aequorivita antarctica]|nr:hypothetical protein [Aequorivita antarctica]